MAGRRKSCARTTKPPRPSAPRSARPPLQAVQAATIRAAELMRVEQDVGSIVVGKFADLIAVTGDPLKHIETLENVQAVIKGGALQP